MIDRKNLSWTKWRSVTLAFICIALLLSGALSWLSITGETVLGCSGSGASCDELLTGEWSRIAGIVPVSILALGLYILLLVAVIRLDSFQTRSSHQWCMLLSFSGCIIGAGVWFTYIQMRVIHQFCIYCMTMHALGLLIAVLIVWRFVFIRRVCSHLQLLIRFFSGVCLAALMALMQVYLMPEAVSQEMAMEGSDAGHSFNEVPMIGSSDATYKIVLLFDYKCSHCQKIHFTLKQTVQRYDGKLAFLLYPSPLNSRCNQFVSDNDNDSEECCELAQIGLAVWIADRDAYSRFDDWMFSFDSGSRWLPRSVEASKAKAIELVGQSRFEDALSDPFVKAHISEAVVYFGRTMQQGKGTVPKLIYGDRWVVLQAYSVEKMVQSLHRSFGIPLP